MQEIVYSIDKKKKISKIDEISRFKLYNLKINSGNKNTIYFKGLYFPVKYNIHYSHLMMDYIGPFIELKQKYPGIKMIFFKNKYLNIPYPTENICEELAKEFNAEIIDITENNYVLEKIILDYRYDTQIYDKPYANWPIPVIPKSVFAEDKDETEEIDLNIKVFKWIEKSAWHLNNYFKNIIFDEEIEKLYISRKKSNTIHKKRISSDISSFSKNMLKRRIHDEIYDTELENRLKDKGYTIIDPLGMGFFEQVKYYMCAKNIVSIDGGGMLNIIFKNPDCRVFQIKVNPDYEWYFKQIIESVTNCNVVEIDVRNIDIKKTIDFIINSIP